MTPVKTRFATAADLERLVDICAAAFEGDTLHMHIIRGEVDIWRGYWHHYLRRQLEAPQNIVVVADSIDTGEVAAFAWWVCYGPYKNPRSIPFNGPEILQEVDKLSASSSAPKISLEQTAAIKASSAKLESDAQRDMEAWTDASTGARLPHWRPTAVATHPAHQGHGYGSAVVRWGTEQADADGMLTGLLASDPGMAMYSRLGFEKVSTMVIGPTTRNSCKRLPKGTKEGKET